MEAPDAIGSSSSHLGAKRHSNSQLYWRTAGVPSHSNYSTEQLASITVQRLQAELDKEKVLKNRYRDALDAHMRASGLQTRVLMAEKAELTRQLDEERAGREVLREALRAIELKAKLSAAQATHFHKNSEESLALLESANSNCKWMEEQNAELAATLAATTEKLTATAGKLVEAEACVTRRTGRLGCVFGELTCAIKELVAVKQELARAEEKGRDRQRLVMILGADFREQARELEEAEDVRRADKATISALTTQVKTLETACHKLRLDAVGGESRVQGPSCRLEASRPSFAIATKRPSAQWVDTEQANESIAVVYPFRWDEDGLDSVPSPLGTPTAADLHHRHSSGHHRALWERFGPAEPDRDDAQPAHELGCHGYDMIELVPGLTLRW